jgi:hypothetical protein
VLLGIVMVALVAGVAWLHVVVFRLLDDLIGVPLTLGVFATVYAAILVLVYREEIAFSLFPGRYSRRISQPRPAPPVQPARIALWPARMVDEAAAKYEKSEEPALAQTAELLRAARHALHEALSENVGDGQPCRVLEEGHGLVSVGISRPNERLPYLHVHQYLEVSTSGYPPVKRIRREILAHTWKIESERYGRGEVLLTIGDDRQPQLVLKPEFRRFAGTTAGWRRLTASLAGPE